MEIKCENWKLKKWKLILISEYEELKEMKCDGGITWPCTHGAQDAIVFALWIVLLDQTSKGKQSCSQDYPKQ